MREILEKRTLTAKHFEIDPLVLEGGRSIRQFHAKCHTGHIHYPDGPLKNGALQDCDTVFEFNATSGLYSMRKASYEAEVSLDGQVTFHNVDHSLKFQFPNPHAVQAAPSDDEWGKIGKGLVWRNLIQDGGHQIVHAGNNSLAKIFRFDVKPVSNKIEFKLQVDGKPSDISEFNKSVRARGLTIGGWPFRFDSSSKTSWLRTPRTWNHRGQYALVTLLIFPRDGEIWARKVIPQEFIDKTFGEAGARLEVDATTSFYAGAADGQTMVYQDLYWSDLVARSTADNVDASSSSSAAYTSWEDGYGGEIGRLHFPFDSSSLGSGASISAATAHGYVTSANGGTCAWVSSTQASGAALVAGDFSRVGSSLLGTTYETGWHVSSDISSLVNKTGYTMLAIREHGDYASVKPDTGQLLSLTYDMSEGTNHPYISVTYTLAPLNITPAAGSASSSKVDPTVILGSINVTPAVGAASTSKTDPAVFESSFSYTPDPAASNASGVDPAVILGSIALTPGAASASASGVDPTVVLGFIVVTPAAASSSTGKVDPALAFTSGIITPAPGSASTSKVDPQIVLSSFSITPVPGFSTAIGVDPIVDYHTWRSWFPHQGPGFTVGTLVLAQRKDFLTNGSQFTHYLVYGEIIGVDVDPVTNEEYADICIVEGEDYLPLYGDQVEWIAIGHKTDPDKTSVIILTTDEENAPYLAFRTGIDSIAKWKSGYGVKARYGRLDGITDDDFGPLPGWGSYQDNFYGRGNMVLGPQSSISWTNVTDPGTKPENNATVGASWDGNLSGIPVRFKTPSDNGNAAGLYIDATHMGYWAGAAWMTYLDSSGNFHLGGSSGGCFSWTAATNRLTIMTSASGKRVVIGPADAWNEIHFYGDSGAGAVLYGYGSSMNLKADGTYFWSQSGLHYIAGFFDGNPYGTVRLPGKVNIGSDNAPGYECDVHGVVNAATGFYKSGVQVVGARQAAIVNPDGTLLGATSAIISILDAMRAHGSITT